MRRKPLVFFSAAVSGVTYLFVLDRPELRKRVHRYAVLLLRRSGGESGGPLWVFWACFPRWVLAGQLDYLPLLFTARFERAASRDMRPILSFSGPVRTSTTISPGCVVSWWKWAGWGG